MKLQLRVIFLILKFFFDISTEVSADDKFRRKLHARAVFKPTAFEIDKSISDSNDAQDIQIETFEQFFTLGQYPVSFVEKLNKFFTLSNERIQLTSEEITTLSSNAEDVSRKNRLVTQVKFYRKIQELQCTNYVILNLTLRDVESTLDDISYYVYIMIEISYKTNFPVSAWLWELHVKLMELQESTSKTEKFLKEHLADVTATLQHLVALCQKNNYLVAQVETSRYDNVGSRRELLGKYLDIYEKKYSPFFQTQNKLPIQNDNLMLKPLWRTTTNLFSDIAGLAFDWYIVYDALVEEIESIVAQWKNRKWTTRPFKHIRCHQLVLDTVKAKLYSFLWVHLTFYQKTDSSEHHERLIESLNYVLAFAYIDDLVFNRILVLMSEINEPDDKQIKETIDILTSEVNNVISHYAGQNHEAKINYSHVERNYGEHYETFLADHRQKFLRFFEQTETTLGAFKLIFISFYINGSKTTDFVFPNRSQCYL